MQYRYFAEENIVANFESGGTSSAAPYVAGTAGLMLGVDVCLSPFEVDNILKLTSKDVENMSINQNFIGMIGAGKLEAGDAVIFAHEMNKTDGNAVIKNHIFNRFNFNLSRINNKLSIENVSFRENNIADFTARNTIHLKPNTHFFPNENGYISLKIENDLDISCDYNSENRSFSSIDSSNSHSIINSILYPNPNNGDFFIKLNGFESNCNVMIIDVNGRIVHSEKISNFINETINFNITNLNSGIYFVKIWNNFKIETLKFIKN